MKRRFFIFQIPLLLAMPVLLISFQNCAPSFQVSQEGTSSLVMNDASAPLDFSGQEDWQMSAVAGGDTTLLNTYALYSPARIKTSIGEKLFLGGWVHPDDWGKNYFNLIDGGVAPEKIIGPDKIWFVENPSNNSADNLTRLKLGLGLVGYHVNDPTLIVPPSDSTTNRSSWLYMYFTMLDNRVAENCRQSGQELIRCLIPLHDIGLAVSTNGGNSWQYVTKIVDHNLAPFAADGGGWTPAAVVEPNGQISLYYASGSTNFSAPLLRRVRLAANGWQRLDTPQIARTADFANHTDFVYTNPDIRRINLGTLARPNWQYLLLYNNAAQKKLLLGLSQNGLSFSRTYLIRSSSSSNILTPNILSATLVNGKINLDYEFSEMTPGQIQFTIKKSRWIQN